MAEDRKKHFERPTTVRPPSLLNITIWTVFVGLVAGFSGYLFARSLLPVGDIDYLSFLGGQRDVKINIEQPFTDLAYKYENSVAGIYKTAGSITVEDKTVFSSEQFLGSAVVVTSDGWLMTTDQVVSADKVLRKVVLGDKVYEITDTKQDPFSGAVFIKIDASFLQPVDFQLTDSLKAGERLFANVDVPNSLKHSFYTSFLTNSHYVTDTYLSSDKADYYIAISGDLPSKVKSAPYFNTDGDLIGLAYTKGEEVVLLPSEYLKQSVKHLLNDTERPTMGVYYLDLENNSGFVRKGVILYHPTLRAVNLNSSAYEAGLKAGDQIVSVNNDVISANNSLSAVIQNYRAGDKIILKISREGVEQDIELEL